VCVAQLLPLSMLTIAHGDRSYDRDKYRQLLIELRLYLAPSDAANIEAVASEKPNRSPIAQMLPAQHRAPAFASRVVPPEALIRAARRSAVDNFKVRSSSLPGNECTETMKT